MPLVIKAGSKIEQLAPARPQKSSTEELIRNAFMEWPTSYGRYPVDILLFLLFLWAALSLYYMLVVAVPSTFLGGLWRYYPKPKESLRYFGEEAHREPLQISEKTLCKVFGWGIYFSFVSSVRIGWREINVGEWLVRMNPHEFTLHTRKMFRIVSTVQSILSVYLIAMAALTYFGRPFG